MCSGTHPAQHPESAGHQSELCVSGVLNQTKSVAAQSKIAANFSDRGHKQAKSKSDDPAASPLMHLRMGKRAYHLCCVHFTAVCNSFSPISSASRFLRSSRCLFLSCLRPAVIDALNCHWWNVAARYCWLREFAAAAIMHCVRCIQLTPALCSAEILCTEYCALIVACCAHSPLGISPKQYGPHAPLIPYTVKLHSEYDPKVRHHRPKQCSGDPSHSVSVFRRTNPIIDRLRSQQSQNQHTHCVQRQSTGLAATTHFRDTTRARFVTHRITISVSQITEVQNQLCDNNNLRTIRIV